MDTEKFTPGLVLVGTLAGGYVLNAAKAPPVLPTALFGAAALVSINNKHPWWAAFFLLGAAASLIAPSIAEAKGNQIAIGVTSGGDIYDGQWYMNALVKYSDQHLQNLKIPYLRVGWSSGISDPPIPTAQAGLLAYAKGQVMGKTAAQINQ